MAKIKVMSAGAVEGPVSELAPEFTRGSGHEVELSFNTVGAHKERFVGGEKTDVIILSFPVIEALEKEGRFAAGSRTDLGRAACGVAVRDGMMMPNIATVEGFKRMLHNAGSIAANDPAHGGSSGIYLAGLLKRMGLTDEIQPKPRAQLSLFNPADKAESLPLPREVIDRLSIDEKSILVLLRENGSARASELAEFLSTMTMFLAAR